MNCTRLKPNIEAREAPQIATAVFGEARVQYDWSHPGKHMRGAVRWAIVRELALMEDGYRIFLR